MGSKPSKPLQQKSYRALTCELEVLDILEITKV